jgi:methyl-accepting chemotaxis protein
MTTLSAANTETTAPASGPALVPLKWPNLTAWLALGLLGLVVVLVGLVWNWKASAQLDAQVAAQLDVTSQTTALRSWLSDAEAGERIPLGPVHDRLVQDAQQLGGDPGLKIQQLALLVQSWLPTETALEDARDAQSKLTESWQTWKLADAALGRQSALTTGAWGNALSPLRTELGQVDPQVLASVYAPKADRAALQKQWSDRLGEYATTAQKLSAQATQDTGLNSAARQAVSDWAQPLQSAAQAAQTLSGNLQVRVDAQSWPTALNNVTLEVSQSLSATNSDQDVRHAQDLAFGGVLLLVLGAAGLGWGLNRQRAVLAEQDRQHQANQASRRSLERITRQMRQIMRQDAAALNGRSKVEESSRHPGYPLASLINQALGLSENVSQQLGENDEKLNRSVQSLRRQLKEVETALRERQQRVDQSAQHHLAQAQGLAALSQQVRKCQEQADSVWSGFRNGQQAVQETTWKTDAIRTKSKSTATRIKRVGESSQSISGALDSIRQFGLRIQLLSFNAAIEAPRAGTEDGRNLAKLVQEIQTLAQNTHDTVKGTENIVRDIQEDAKQGVAIMEQNTEDVVEANKRAQHAGTVLHEIERQAETMVDILNRLVDALEARAIEDADLAEADKRDRAAVERMMEQLDQIVEGLALLTQSGQEGTRAVRQRMSRLPAA